jgi:hypothetical protein
MDVTSIPAALAAAQRPDYGSDWTREHKGEFLYTEGYVWECGDDDCACSHASLVAVFANSEVQSFVRIPLWQGRFFTDHEAGADAELAAMRQALRETAPDIEAATRWQTGVDYGLKPEVVGSNPSAATNERGASPTG